MASLFVTLALIAVEFVYLRGWYQLRNAIPQFALRLAAGSFFVRIVCAVGGCRVSPRRAGSSLAHRPYGAAPSSDDGERPADSARRPGNRPAGRLRKPFGRLVLQSRCTAFGRIITHPVFCWFAGTATVVAWHIPALFELGMRSTRWHAVEYACFFAAGLLFWWPVVQPWPSLATWSPLGRALVPFPGDLTVRRLVGVSYVLRPRCLSTLSVRASALQYLTSRRSGSVRAR